MSLSYEDAVETEVSREEARREIAKHDCGDHEGLTPWEHFLKEVGDKPTYLGKEVLDWLGY